MIISLLTFYSLISKVLSCLALTMRITFLLILSCVGTSMEKATLSDEVCKQNMKVPLLQNSFSAALANR